MPGGRGTAGPGFGLRGAGASCRGAGCGEPNPKNSRNDGVACAGCCCGPGFFAAANGAIALLTPNGATVEFGGT